MAAALRDSVATVEHRARNADRHASMAYTQQTVDGARQAALHPYPSASQDMNVMGTALLRCLVLLFHCEGCVHLRGSDSSGHLAIIYRRRERRQYIAFCLWVYPTLVQVPQPSVWKYRSVAWISTICCDPALPVLLSMMLSKLPDASLSRS